MVDQTKYSVFLAGSPPAQREYRTIEFYHPNMAAPLRFVSDYVDISLTLESGAPRNGNQSVLFTALSMVITEPSEAQDGDVGPLQIRLGAVGNEVQNALNEIGDTLEPIEIIYRKYYSGDLSEPVRVLYSSMSSISFSGYTEVSIAAEDTDLSNRAGGEIYTVERFPALQGLL